jgi:hypothetical protein
MCRANTSWPTFDDFGPRGACAPPKKVYLHPVIHFFRSMKLFMKSIFPRLTLLVMLLMIGIASQAQDSLSANAKTKAVEEQSHAALDKVMKYATEKKYDSFAKVMAYTGRDPERNMRAVINTRDPHEKLAMENMCNYIFHWVSKSALYNAQNFRVIKGAAGDLIFWDAEFSLLNGKSKKFVMSFVEIQGKYFLCSFEKA